MRLVPMLRSEPTFPLKLDDACTIAVVKAPAGSSPQVLPTIPRLQQLGIRYHAGFSGWRPTAASGPSFHPKRSKT